MLAIVSDYFVTSLFLRRLLPFQLLFLLGVSLLLLLLNMAVSEDMQVFALEQIEMTDIEAAASSEAPRLLVLP